MTDDELMQERIRSLGSLERSRARERQKIQDALYAKSQYDILIGRLVVRTREQLKMTEETAAQLFDTHSPLTHDQYILIERGKLSNVLPAKERDKAIAIIQAKFTSLWTDVRPAEGA